MKDVNQECTELLDKTTDQFIDSFLDAIPDLLKHHYISKNQSKFLRDKKDNLQEGECVVIGDFAENFDPVINESAQGEHWTTTQVTIHPFVAYYKKDNELKIENFVIVSDVSNHNNEEVYTFQTRLVAHLKK